MNRTFEMPRWGVVTIATERYAAENNALAVQLWISPDGFPEPLATASVNMPDATAKLPPNCFYLKAWSENEEIAEALINSGWIKPRTEFPTAYSGYVSADAYELLEERK